MGTNPSAFREEVQLRDGTPVLLRPIRTEDAQGLRALFNRLSPDSIYLRFLEARKELTLQQARQFATVDYEENMAIVAAIPHPEDDGDIIGVARYSVLPSPNDRVAETAVVVEDAYQNRGLGTILLLRLVQYATDRGIDSLQASVHQSNAHILYFIKKSGLPAKRKLEEGGVWEITVDLDGPAGGPAD